MVDFGSGGGGEGLHLGLCDAALGVRLLARAQARHEDRLGAAAGGDAGGAGRGVEDAEDHGDDLGLHLADAREDVGVDGVGDGELAERLRLQLDQAGLAVVHGAGHVAVLPARVVHRGQRLHLLLQRLVRPAFLRQRQVPRDARPGLDKLRLQLRDRLVDLLLHLATHARRPQEEAVERAADHNVGVEK